MTPTIIGVDLDGTMLGGTEGRYGFLPAGIDALRHFVRTCEGRVAFVTGRDMNMIEKLLHKEGIAENEAWPQAVIAEERFLYFRGERGYVPDAEWNRNIYDTERAQFERIRRGMNELLAAEPALLNAGARRVEGEVEERRGYVELLFADAPSARIGESIAAEWLLRHQLPYKTIRNVMGVSIRHRSVGKGALLSKLCEAWGAAPSKALAIGDSANDLSMLDGSHGFLSAAPGNAEAEVREAVLRNGGYVASGAFGNGVAEAVYRRLPPVRTS